MVHFLQMFGATPEKHQNGTRRNFPIAGFPDFHCTMQGQRKRQKCCQNDFRVSNWARRQAKAGASPWRQGNANTLQTAVDGIRISLVGAVGPNVPMAVPEQGADTDGTRILRRARFGLSRH
jgi:hypothetical protein